MLDKSNSSHMEGLAAQLFALMVPALDLYIQSTSNPISSSMFKHELSLIVASGDWDRLAEFLKIKEP